MRLFFMPFLRTATNEASKQRRTLLRRTHADFSGAAGFTISQILADVIKYVTHLLSRIDWQAAMWHGLCARNQAILNGRNYEIRGGGYCEVQTGRPVQGYYWSEGRSIRLCAWNGIPVRHGTVKILLGCKRFSSRNFRELIIISIILN